jgi:hypothetical protein
MRQAKGLGRFLGGAAATPVVLHGLQGSGASPARLLTFPLVLLVSLFALGTGSAIAAPSVTSTSVSVVTAKSAVLEAEINPEGEASTYHFEYGPADCSANPCTSIPIPNGTVGPGSSAVKIVNEITGLSPDTTYHFRVVAVNGSGPTAGPDRTFTTYELPTPDTNCPNQVFRVGASAGLPDCRAYEMVSPVDKNGGDITTACNFQCFTTALNQSSVNGGKITYSSYKGFGDAKSTVYSNQYLATRNADGWISHGISPERGPTVLNSFPPHPTLELTPQFKAFSNDLSQAWITNTNVTPLASPALAGYVNLYRRNNATDSYLPLYSELFAPIEPAFIELELQGISGNGNTSVFVTQAALTPDAPTGNNRKLYQWSASEGVTLVSILPDGTPDVENSSAGFKGFTDFNQLSRIDNAISDDGSRVFWTSSFSTGAGNIYARIDGETTILVSHGGPISPGGGATFWTANNNGDAVIYSEGSPAAPERELYEFDVDAETSTLITDEGFGVLGASDDLSYLYFMSEEDLAAGATAGEQNLYVRHNGVVTFIATLATVDSTGSPSNTQLTPIFHHSRVTPDGRHLTFASIVSLTGYDNADAKNGEPASEIYVYDAPADDLFCASCNPSEARPIGAQGIKPFQLEKAHASYWAAAWLPTWETQFRASRALSDDGNRLYFNAFDSLVPGDTNGVQDVYEWTAPGVGSCGKSSGCISLISSGKGSADSEFVDATPDGTDVFISTESSLVRQDPGARDIYDARVDGGFPPPPPPPPPCFGDSCQTVPEPPRDATPTSASFRGAGNPVPRSKRRCAGKRSKRTTRVNREALKKKAVRCKRRNGRAGR